MSLLLWGVVPYVSFAVLAVGTWWRWRYDQFGWTTRSSQVYESRLLRIGSPLFHFGILVVVLGHVIGLLVPASWTKSAGLSRDAYHAQALVLGTVAGLAALVGVAILVYRRRTTVAVFSATTRNDKAMYVVLVAALVAGITATLLGAGAAEERDYRETVSPWFRSLFVLRPDIDAMADAGTAFQVHALIAFLLFACWPFTRLVHAFSAPLGYLFRPYVVYRRREPSPSAGVRERRDRKRVP